MNVLSFKGVSRAFPGKAVLADIKLNVAAGEVVSVLGPNGIGKSTLAAIAAGLDTGFEGQVERVVPTAPIILQDYRASLLPWLSIRANIEFPLKLKGISPAERRRRVDALLDRAPMRLDLSTPVRRLSGGQSQLVSVLRALATQSPFIVCDEPFSALDYSAREELLCLLADFLRETATAALFISHDIEDAQRLSDRIVVLNGRPSSLILEVEVSGKSVKDRQLDSESAIKIRRSIRAAIARQM